MGVRSLETQGQVVESLMYPIGSRMQDLPGILTVCLGDNKVERYFHEGRLSLLVVNLIKLELVSGDVAVQGIEAQRLVMGVMSDDERSKELERVMGRIRGLEEIEQALSGIGIVSYANRIQIEKTALQELLATLAGNTTVKDEELNTGSAEAVVENLYSIVRGLKLTTPSESGGSIP